MSKLEDCIEALRRADSRTISQRASRMLAMSEFISGYCSYGADETFVLMEEARVSYINGCFVASFISAMSSIEHMLVCDLSLRGFTSFEGEKIDGIFKSVKCLKANTRGNEALWDKLCDLIQKRNAYVHIKKEKNALRRVNRAKEIGAAPNEISTQDAEAAIKAMYEVFDATIKPGDLSEFVDSDMC